jgi:hypothetical protein
MNSEDMQAAYIERVNALLETVDFSSLDRSCNSEDSAYACKILKQMHDLFTEVYQTDSLDYEYEFVDVPAVIRGRNTGHLCLGLVTLDLQSSGEHFGTWFFTPRGVIDQGFEKMRPEDELYLKAFYTPYDYWYTVYIQRDHHVDFDHVPEKVADMLNACYPEQQEQKQAPEQTGQEMR